MPLDLVPCIVVESVWNGWGEGFHSLHRKIIYIYTYIACLLYCYIIYCSIYVYSLFSQVLHSLYSEVSTRSKINRWRESFTVRLVVVTLFPSCFFFLIFFSISCRLDTHYISTFNEFILCNYRQIQRESAVEYLTYKTHKFQVHMLTFNVGVTPQMIDFIPQFRIIYLKHLWNGSKMTNYGVMDYYFVSSRQFSSSQYSCLVLVSIFGTSLLALFRGVKCLIFNINYWSISSRQKGLFKSYGMPLCIINPFI